MFDNTPSCRHVCVAMLLLTAVLLLFNSCDESAVLNPKNFSTCSPIPVARASASVFVLDDFAFVLAGRDASFTYLKDMWKYDTHRDEWQQLPDVPFKGRAKGVAGVVNGKAYFGLGFNGQAYNDTSYLRDFWMFDPNAESWTRKADFPNNRSGVAASFVDGVYLYVLFGFYDYFSTDVYRYNTATERWEEMMWGDLTSRVGAVACSACNRFFVGTGYNTGNLNDWYEYLPLSNEWMKRKSMPDKGRVFGSAIAVDEKIFVLGGRLFGGTETRQHFYDCIYEYDINKNSWTKDSKLPAGGRENLISFTLNNVVYFGLGQNEKGEILNDMYRWEEK